MTLILQVASIIPYFHVLRDEKAM
ncbi:unnamed protein product, partial [Rotaria sp. Silwood1]